MLRSNSKKAIENIHSYIISHSDFSSYEMETPKTIKEIAPVLMGIFKEEKRYTFGRMSLRETFVDWLQGLPSVFDSCYYYNRSAVDDLGCILEETEAEKNRFSESEAEEMLSRLIFRELYKVCGYSI